MTAVKTEIGANDAARDSLLQRVANLAALTDQEAIEELAALLGGVTAAPASGDYIVGSANGTLTAERIATDTATIDVDIITAGQAKWNIIADSVDNTFLANMAQATIKGRASGAGTGDPTDLTATQTKTVLGFPTSTTDNTVPRFDGTGGNLQTSGVTIGDTDIVGGVAAIGIGGATGDTTNRISSNSDAVLFNHAGTSSQIKVNKNATANTASHLFQVGFSGRAEFGLIGDDDFQLKTSPDGSAFTTALTALNASGALRVGVNLSPGANDGAALGATALGWSDAFFASGGTLNFNNGDVLITHSANTLAFSGASNGYSFADGAAQPATNDGAALGTTALGWADLHLASGGAVNWANGALTLAQSSTELRLSSAAQTVLALLSTGGNCGVELGRIDGTSSTPFFDFHSGATAVDYDARILASGGSGVNGAGLLTISATAGVSLGTATPFTTGTIELGNASDTTLARSSAGNVSIEGNVIYRAGGTDVTVPDGGTGVSSLTAHAVICGGTTSTGAVQSIAGVGNSGQVLTSNGAGALPTFQTVAAGGITAMTVQATTSGTTFDFTSLPAGVDRILIMLDSVSLSGSDNFIVQLGDSGGVETSGYTSKSGNRATEVSSTAGFIWLGSDAAQSFSGIVTITRITSNSWVASHSGQATGNREVICGGGRKDLSAELDRVRLAATGANSFDSGQVNIFYE